MLCSLCGVAGASLRCPCHSVHYCNNECQKKHFSQHKERCTVWLLKKLQKVEDKARSISYPLIRDPEDELERDAPKGSGDAPTKVDVDDFIKFAELSHEAARVILLCIT